MSNRKKILLHSCCAPCSCFPVKVLRELDFNITIYWYNHNIHPYTEYRKRLESLLYFANKQNIPVIMDDVYPLEYFMESISDDFSFGVRCVHCYDHRLEKTADKAKELEFDYFTSTLLYSKYQNHDYMKSRSIELAEKFDVEFYYQDFRLGWREGIELSKKLGLYRQQYCGCIFSERDRYQPKEDFLL